MKGFNPRWIVGKTIAAVDMRPFETESRKAHDPIITFTDGSQIQFLTEETGYDYGTDIVYRKRPRLGETTNA